MSDDDTVFSGEFSDDWTVNGKVGALSIFHISEYFLQVHKT